MRSRPMSPIRTLFAKAAALGVAGAVLLVATPSYALGWHVVQKTDRFTDAKECRIEPGNSFARAFVAGALQVYTVSYFFIATVNGEVRAGVTNDRGLPVPYDIQVRVDEQPVFTISAADTPIDVAPAAPMIADPGLDPSMRAAMEQTRRAILAASSPYKIVTGQRALELVRQLANGHHAMWRAVGINSAALQPTDIDTGGLREALRKCDITVDQPATDSH